MPTPPFSRRTLLRGTMAAGVAAAFTPLAVRPVFAEVAVNATTGYLTFNRSGALIRSNADGSGDVNLNHAVKSNVPWTVDGSRFAYTHTGSSGSGTAGIWTRRADGSNPVQVTFTVPEEGWDSTQDQDLAFSAAGRFIYFSRFGRITAVTADGNWLRDDIIFYNGSTVPGDRHPHIVAGQPLIFDRRINNTGAPGIYRADSAVSQTLIVPNAKCGRYSPNGKQLAYITSDATYAGLQVWVANADGTGGARLGTVQDLLVDLTWAPDGSAIYVSRQSSSTSVGEIVRVDAASGAQTTVDNGIGAGLQPVTKEQNLVIRMWGGIALDTAIAISRFNWADHDAPTDPDDQNRLKAGAVVIGRGDEFYDALAGSALAANKFAPLLITPPAQLYAPARAELQRVLPKGGTVYLLGGTAAISPAIETEVRNMGYNVTRCGGADMFDTAVQINRQITGPGVQPSIIIIATGIEFYDALAAGAAAGAYEGGVVVLTNGDAMPAFSANYLNLINPAFPLIITAGGPGDRALQNALDRGQIPNWTNQGVSWFQVIGGDAIETAEFLARFMFSGPQIAAIATISGWYDALTGGAMVGNNYGPLLLTPPGNLDARVARYLNENSSNLSYAAVLGGTAALPQALVPQIGANLGIGDGYIYDEVTATGVSVAAARIAGMKRALEQVTGSGVVARSSNARRKPEFAPNLSAGVRKTYKR